jgi:hypothetical protein
VPDASGLVSTAPLVVVTVLLVIGSFFGLQALVSEADATVTSLVERQIDVGMFIGTAAIAVLRVIPQCARETTSGMSSKCAIL